MQIQCQGVQSRTIYIFACTYCDSIYTSKKDLGTHKFGAHQDFMQSGEGEADGENQLRVSFSITEHSEFEYFASGYGGRKKGVNLPKKSGSCSDDTGDMETLISSLTNNPEEASGRSIAGKSSLNSDLSPPADFVQDLLTIKRAMVEGPRQSDAEDRRRNGIGRRCKASVAPSTRTGTGTGTRTRTGGRTGARAINRNGVATTGVPGASAPTVVTRATTRSQTRSSKASANSSKTKTARISRSEPEPAIIVINAD